MYQITQNLIDQLAKEDIHYTINEHTDNQPFDRVRVVSAFMVDLQISEEDNLVCMGYFFTFGQNVRDLLAEINRQNLASRYVRFSRTETGKIKAEVDTVITPETIGPVCSKLLRHMIEVIEKASVRLLVASTK